MEKSGETAPKPWDGPEFNWVEERGYLLPSSAAKKLTATVTQALEAARLPNADEVREELLSNYHTPPDGPDLDRPNQFVKALGIEPRPVIMFDRDMPLRDFHNLMRDRGIIWHDDSQAQFSHQIGASILAPLPSSSNTEIERTIVHEQTHANGVFPGAIWAEGIACLLEELYAAAVGVESDRVPTIDPPYNVHSLGLMMLSKLCSQSPALFDATLGLAANNSVETYRNFLTQAYGLLGERRFWYISHAHKPKASYDDIPSGLQGLILPSGTDSRALLNDLVLPIVQNSLRGYEARTGYSFVSSETPARLGLIALHEGDEKYTTDLTALINNITDTLQ